jgi:hypothetical protein
MRSRAPSAITCPKVNDRLTSVLPCDVAEDSSTKAYIVCTFFGKNTKEVWIFNGENLDIGSVCKLSHPSRDFGFTIHTASLQKIAKPTAFYNIRAIKRK